MPQQFTDDVDTGVWVETELVTLPALPYSYHQGELSSTALAEPPMLPLAGSRVSSSALMHSLMHAHPRLQGPIRMQYPLSEALCQ